MQTTPVTCPECGRTAHITTGRRDASDFCAGCDFPLFWSSAASSVRAQDEETDEALRRLPGTDGRGLRYSVPCPTCGELNLPTAWVCLRCAGSMAPPPPPAPVPVPQPLPVPPPAPEPEPVPTPPARTRWWVLVAAALAMTTLVVVVWQLGS